MGWKGALRTISASINQSARESERKFKQQEKKQALKEAKNTVYDFERYIKHIVSIHIDLSSDFVDWETIAKDPPPIKPKYKNTYETSALYKYENFKPNILHRLMRTEEKNRKKLKYAINLAAEKDQRIHDKKMGQYNIELNDWKKHNEFARCVVEKDPKTCLEVVKKYNPFADIKSLGSTLDFSVNNDGNVTVKLKVNGNEIIPREKYTLRQSGTLSKKNMPKGEFNELYQDHICSSVLRIANELFAILPIKHLIINANDDFLNSKTGHIEEQTILSVYVMRSTFEKLNLTRVDPSDSMGNFIHNMKFKKSSGFGVVEPLNFSDAA
jgi:hypothetical protein